MVMRFLVAVLHSRVYWLSCRCEDSMRRDLHAPDEDVDGQVHDQQHQQREPVGLADAAEVDRV
jgi:hypothetical protein